jgi:hypothetical protein
MKIIKQGKSKEELEKVLRHTVRFTCGTCNCVFEADEGEYSVSSALTCEYGFYTVCTCVCPNCQSVASENTLRRLSSSLY